MQTLNRCRHIATHSDTFMITPATVKTCTTLLQVRPRERAGDRLTGSVPETAETMASSEPDSEVHCLRKTMPSMSRLRKARAFFHDLPGRSGFGVPSGAPAAQARVSFVTRENVERSFMVLREGHQLDRSDLQHVQVSVDY